MGKLDCDWYVGLCVQGFQDVCYCGFGCVVIKFDIVIGDVVQWFDCCGFDGQDCCV